MQVIRKGDNNKTVGRWQYFLRGVNCYFGHVDNDFGAITDKATKAFQAAHHLSADGIVGNGTWGKAIQLGFEESEGTDSSKSGSLYPAKPDFKPLVTNASREDLFGVIEYDYTPTTRNPEKITITNDFKQNIVKLNIPQFVPVKGSGTFYFHKAGAEQVKAFFAAMEKEGLHTLLKTFDGSFYPRYVRGSRSTLSNHSWGTAFDINVKWNGLGRRPALVGQDGSVREIAELGIEYGFYWGGWFSRMDGMHFELAKIL